MKFWARISSLNFLSLKRIILGTGFSGFKPSKNIVVSGLVFFVACIIAFEDYQRYKPSSVEYDIAYAPFSEEKEEIIPRAEEVIEPFSQEENALPSSTQMINTPPSENTKYLVIGKGDTLNRLLISAGINKSDVQEAVAAVHKIYNVKQFKIGQSITLKLGHDNASGTITLQDMRWKSSPELEIHVLSQGGKILAKKHTIILKKSVEGVVGKIQSNLHAAALKQGAPSNLVKSAIRYLSFDVNFQHDVKIGTPFALLFEVYRDPDGKIVKYGNLLYAGMMAKGKLKQIFRYEACHGVNYYTQNGECAVKSFMRTPLEAKRLSISSGYGMRMHPVRGYTMAHKGIDYRAPAGTPIVAAAAGTVKMAKYWSGFGLYVAINHGQYTTEYGHMRKISPGIRPGVKVAQGQRIGEVGCTGTATGNHLHYGVLRNGQHINPASIKVTSSEKLSGKEFAKFTGLCKKINAQVKPSLTEFVLAPSVKMMG